MRKLDRSNLGIRIRENTAAERERLGAARVAQLLDAGRAWNLAPTLAAGGAVIFPHVGLEALGCGSAH